MAMATDGNGDRGIVQSLNICSGLFDTLVASDDQYTVRTAGMMSQALDNWSRCAKVRGPPGSCLDDRLSDYTIHKTKICDQLHSIATKLREITTNRPKTQEELPMPSFRPAAISEENAIRFKWDNFQGTPWEVVSASIDVLMLLTQDILVCTPTEATSSSDVHSSWPNDKGLSHMSASIEARLLEEAQLAQKFCDSSTQLFTSISHGIDCVGGEHKVRVHLSDSRDHKRDIETLFHTCTSTGIYPTISPLRLLFQKGRAWLFRTEYEDRVEDAKYSGGYPVIFCNIDSRPVPQFGPPASNVNICSHIQEIRRKLKPVEIHSSNTEFSDCTRIWVAGTATKSDIRQKDIICSYEKISTIFMQKSISNFEGTHRRRLQCLLSRNLLYLYPSPWLKDMCDLQNLQTPNLQARNDLDKFYTLCIVGPVRNENVHSQLRHDDTLALEIFMSRFGLLLLSIQLQKQLELSKAEIMDEQGYNLALRRYIKEFEVEWNLPICIQKAVIACRSFPDMIEQSCLPFSLEYGIKCRLTILKEILEPLDADLRENCNDDFKKSIDLATIGEYELKREYAQTASVEAYLELHRHKKETIYPPDGTWVPMSTMEMVWRNIDLKHFFELHGITLSKKECVRIEKEYLSAVSILVTIKWEKWWRFRDLFLENKDQLFRNDQLPIRDMKLLEQYLGLQDASLFWKMQHEYVDVKLPDRSCKQLLPNQALPFLKNGHKKLGAERQGKLGAERQDGCGVYEEVIPPNCLRFPDGGLNDAPYRVARKIVNGKTIHTEEQVAILLRDSRTKNEALVKILSVYRRDGFLDIVYPLATSDLQVFMKDKIYVDFWERSISMPSLLVAIRHLTSGLEQIHRGTENPIRKSSVLCHMDFGPRNILVYETGNAGHNSIDLKICDFGIAKILPKPHQRPQNDDSIILQKEQKQSEANRPPGTYQAPETHHNSGEVGQESDVWSLACIIITLVTRKLSGIEGLEQFEDLRAPNDDSEDFFFHEHNPTALNEAVDGWLKDLSDSKSDLSLSMLASLRVPTQPLITFGLIETIPQRISDILREALIIDPAQRSSSARLLDALGDLWY